MADLDRRITLKLSSGGSRNQYGEWQAGTVVDHAVWAQRVDAIGDTDTGPEGDRHVSIRTYRVRYRGDVADADLSDLAIEAGGIVYTVTGRRIPAPRDRFIELDVARSD